ncbi:sodium-independent anion transporter, partial [Paraburkholderia sp.]|uniref:sodium-independent anion transporter n=1 Tax=Paraburkholderia sp. TaxID=1926495 RepID=UPI002F4091B7
ILKGVIVAVLVSMLLVVRRAAHPHVAVLGRIPGARSFSDLERHAENEAVPQVLVVRPEASLLYFNVEHVRETIRHWIDTAPEPVRLVICDLSASPVVDLAGARMLAALHAALRPSGTALKLVGAHADVRDMLRAAGLEDHVGPIGRLASVADLIDAFEARAGGADGIDDAKLAPRPAA